MNEVFENTAFYGIVHRDGAGYSGIFSPVLVSPCLNPLEELLALGFRHAVDQPEKLGLSRCLVGLFVCYHVVVLTRDGTNEITILQ